MERFGIIVGTGTADLLALKNAETVKVETGKGVAAAIVGELEGRPVALLKRHGEGHRVPPHRINFEANTLALKELGVRYCLSTSAVGSLREDWGVGAISVLSDFIDFTRRGVTTLFHDEVVHTGFSEPFCEQLRNELIAAATHQGLAFHPTGVYLCVDGPRYETPAEVRLYRHWGADVAGMTVATEAILAREAGICYATLAIVTNLGTGLSEQPHDHVGVEKVMQEMGPTLAALFRHCVSRAPNV